jgi:hypothetical protein
MAKRRKVTKPDLKVMEFLRLGGSKIPAGFAGKATAATKSLRHQQFDAGRGIRAQGTKLFRQLKGEATAKVNDPANKKALDRILGLHRKLAAKKLHFPKVPSGIGGFFPGRISGTLVPPFDFADTIPDVIAGGSELSVSANVNGQIGASALTAETGFNGGSEYARVGFFFHPMTQGTLTVSASPTYSFEWSTNSLNNAFVTSSGDVGLTVYGMNELGQILSTAGSFYKIWQQAMTGIQFDFGFDLQNSMSASLAVAPGQIYLCFVEVFAGVFGSGWPTAGSLASAMASATVPSMSFAFDPQVVAEP